MSSKQRKEKSYNIHGMQSISSVFISRHQFAIKPYDSYATNRVGTGCLFRCLKQFGLVKKKKNIQWKIHRYKSTSLFRITAGYNQWCPRLHHKEHTVQAIPSMHTVQVIPSNVYSTSNSLNTHSTRNSLKKKKKMRWKRKWFISKEEKEGDGRESG